ncbi:MAG: glycosyltransferase [Nitrospiraceae bacterium]|nr:MAG: glycosyltransferase [Nitrospiraceae bacterium]
MRKDKIILLAGNAVTGHYGINVIINNIKKTLNDYDLVVTDTLQKSCSANSFLIAMTLNNCYNAINSLNKDQLNIAFLIDATSLCVKSAAKDYLIRKDFSLTALKQATGLLSRYFLYSYKESEIVKHFNYLIVVSDVDRKYLINRYPKFKEKIIIIPNGTELRQVSLTRPDVFTFGFLTGFTEGAFEDIRWFLDDYYPRIKRAHKDVKVLIAGRGAPEHMINYFRRIDDVEFIGEIEDLLDFFNKITVMVTTVRKECGILNKVLDAFSYKKTVIGCSRNFKAFTKLKNGDGYLACDSADEYINAITTLKSDPDLFRTLTENAYDYILTYHNWDKNYLVLKDIINKNN